MSIEQLKKKYRNHAVVTQVTKNYSMITYPHSYYMELVDIILKKERKENAR